MGFLKRWEPDGRDALSPKAYMLLSIVVTGAIGFLLEYFGTSVFDVFRNSSPVTIYLVVAVWAFGLGPLLVVLRRASIVVPMAIVGFAFAVLVLFNRYFFVVWEFHQGGFIDTGRLWAPRIWEFREGAIFGLHHPLLIAFAAGLMETIVVPISVGLQLLLTSGLKRKPSIPLEEEEDLFRSSIVPRTELKPDRDLGFYFMRFIFFSYGIYFVYMLLGLLVGGRDLPVVGMFFVSPPETVNSIMKIILMISFANVGAFNPGVRREAAILLTVGHLISVGASLGLYFISPGYPAFPGDQQFLLSSVLGDGALLIVLVYYVVGPRAQEIGNDSTEDPELRSPASTLYRAYFVAFGALFTLFSIGIVYARLAGNPEEGLGAVFGAPDPLVSNSLTKYGTLAATGWFLAFQPSMRRYFVPSLIIAFSLSLCATVIYGYQGSTVLISRFGTRVTLPDFMMNHIVVDGLGLLLLLALRRLQYHVDFQITSLRPGSAECTMGLHQALREASQMPEVASREVLQRIDEYVVSIRGRRRGLVSFPFWLVEHVFPFILWFRPAFSTMSRDEQRWMMRRHFLRPRHERVRASIPFVADVMFQIGDIVHALVTLAFFSTDRAHALVGYVTPDSRKRLQPDIAAARPPDGATAPGLPVDNRDSSWRKPLSDPGVASSLLTPRVGFPAEVSSIPDEVDYCIVGSGAAGGLIAYRLGLAKGNSNSICVIERGGYFSPVRDFTSDEMRMIRQLYTEGGLQVSRSFDFTILQGECVGGTTVINNAVCFRIPEVSKGEWDSFGVDVEALGPHYDRVAQEINIAPVSDVAVNATVERLFIDGVRKYNEAPGGIGRLSSAQRNSGNFLQCLGCGLCNIGCRYMRKLSVLETYLPWAQAHNVQVVPDMEGVRCVTEPRGEKTRATGVVARLPNGTFRTIRVRKAVILSAGAIASSRFLQRSALGNGNAGKGLACNFAVPPLAIFDRTLNAFDSLQMTMFAEAETQEAVFENTYFPPGSLSISLPQYFRGHEAMMRAYTSSVNITALVGSDASGVVSAKPDVLFGRGVDWTATPSDLNRIKKSLATIIGIAQGAGARRILLPTHPVLIVDLPTDTRALVEKMDRVLNDDRYFNFVTAHPQGGNLMAGDSFEERVVDLDFRVRDCENVFVCDASVFPRGIRVNPQWTIMAMASAASESVVAST